MNGRHKGKSALVFGAGSGIGRGAAIRLASEGAHLVIADVNRDGLEQTAAACNGHGTDVDLIVTDIADTTDLRAAVARSVELYGRLDYMINAAGIVQSCDFFDVEEKDWDRLTAINQKGTAFACQIAGRQMISQIPKGPSSRNLACNGKILNFSSIAGRRGRAFQLAYAASKAAIISITQSTALALAPHRINVNAISPSVVLTPMFDTHIRAKAKTIGSTVDEAMDSMLQAIPLRRAAEVEEIAAVVSFLCSQDADFITGQTINVDGGFEMN